jgi:hypothetical protein
VTVDQREWLADWFEANRPLGSVREADDAVQESWLPPHVPSLIELVRALHVGERHHLADLHVHVPPATSSAIRASCAGFGLFTSLRHTFGASDGVRRDARRGSALAPA